MTTSILKHTCDRCGEFIEYEGDNKLYPSDWQNITLGQTGARLDLCLTCNHDLFHFLDYHGANNMYEACFNEREVI